MSSTNPSSRKNRFAQAFQESFNMVGLAGAAGISLALLNPLPLLFGVVAEAAYLLFVPDSKWYESRLGKRFDAEVEERRAALVARLLPTLSERMQERYNRLNFIRGQITSQHPGQENETWFREVLRKLDYLLEKFLMFASKEAQFRAYLHGVYQDIQANSGRMSAGFSGSPQPQQKRRDNNDDPLAVLPTISLDFDLFDAPRVRIGRRGDNFGRARVEQRGSGGDRNTPGGPPDDGPPRLADRWAQETVKAVQAHYDREIAEVGEERDAEDDYNTKAILEKRGEVLEQRREYVGKIGKILTNLGHQMELLEDSFGLINDQLRARSPEQVLADIEGVVYQTDSMTKLLEELAPYEQMSARLDA